MISFPFQYQQYKMDCGPTCMFMVSKYYGRVFGLEKLMEITQIGKEWGSMLGISDAAEQIGFQTTALELGFITLMKDAPKPAILYWGQNHFIILITQKKTAFHSLFRNSQFNTIAIADPAKGIITISKDLFLQKWINDKKSDKIPTGIALLIEP